MRFSLAAALLVAVLAGPAGGETLALLQSKGIEPYERASQAFSAALEATVHRFDLAAGRQDGVVDDVRRLAPSLVVAVGTDALRVAAEKLADFPVVYLMVLDAPPYPQRAAPVSGVTLGIPAEAVIDAIGALSPRAKTVGVLYDPTESGLAVAQMSEHASQAGLTLLAEAAASTKDALAAMPSLFERCDAFVIVPDRTTATDACFELAVLLSLRHRVLVIAPSRKFVEKGALAAFETSYEDVGVQAAEIAKRLLSGRAVPPSESPRTLNLVVNGKIARKLGVSAPRTCLGRRVEVLP